MLLVHISDSQVETVLGNATTIVCLSAELDDYALYGRSTNGFGTPLVARGSLDELLTLRRQVSEGAGRRVALQNGIEMSPGLRASMRCHVAWAERHYPHLLIEASP